MLMQVQPYGALSLKSSVPFSLNGILGFYIKGGDGADSAVDNSSSSAPGFDVGDLELQFESSSPSAYTISKSITLRWALERGTCRGLRCAVLQSLAGACRPQCVTESPGAV